MSDLKLVKPDLTQRVKHVLHKGNCEICGCAEGSLSTECCGYALHERILNAIIAGNLDYSCKRWVIGSAVDAETIQIILLNIYGKSSS